MLGQLASLLDHLSQVIDPSRQAAIEDRYRRALDGDTTDRLPLVVCSPLPRAARFQPFPHGQVFDDPQRMLYNELVHAFDTSIALRDRMRDDLPLTVRANFGTVLIASMFGAPVQRLDDNPPWVRHAAGREIPLEAIAECDPLDFSRGWLPRVVETMEVYHAILKGWPELYRQIRIVLPDLQGPLDNLELIRGSDLFRQLAAEPKAVETGLHAMATAQIGAARHLAALVRDGPHGYSHQHAVMIKGNVLLRADTAIMLSPPMYREQVAPHDERVLRELGGGGIHSCGCIQHLAGEFLRLPTLRSLDLGQPELNDVVALYTRARERSISLLRVAVSEDDLLDGRLRERFPTGVVLVHHADSFECGRRVASSLY
jgi:hypothetical protein